MSSQVPWIVCGRLPLRVYRGPGPVRASVHLSRVLMEAGVTPAVHLHKPAPSATPHHYPYSAWLARNPQSAGWTGHSGWTARSTAGRLRRLEDSGEDPPAGKYVPNASSPSRRPHPVPLADNVGVLLAARFCTVAPFGQWVQTHCP